MNPDEMKRYFYLGQIGLGAAVLVVAWLFLRPKTPESNFRVREADRKQGPKGPAAGGADLANAKLKQPLRIGGISISGQPHEILGVPLTAGPEEIQRAYRELMKQYHPDKIGPPGSREWADAQ